MMAKYTTIRRLGLSKAQEWREYQARARWRARRLQSPECPYCGAGMEHDAETRIGGLHVEHNCPPHGCIGRDFGVRSDCSECRAY